MSDPGQGGCKGAGAFIYRCRLEDGREGVFIPWHFQWALQLCVASLAGGGHLGASQERGWRALLGVGGNVWSGPVQQREASEEGRHAGWLTDAPPGQTNLPGSSPGPPPQLLKH